MEKWRRQDGSEGPPTYSAERWKPQQSTSLLKYLSSAKPEHPGLKARTVVSCHRSQSSSYGPQGRRDRSQSWSYGPSLVFIAESRHRTDHRVVRTAVSRSHSMNRRGRSQSVVVIWTIVSFHRRESSSYGPQGCKDRGQS